MNRRLFFRSLPISVGAAVLPILSKLETKSDITKLSEYAITLKSEYEEYLKLKIYGAGPINTRESKLVKNLVNYLSEKNFLELRGK